MDALLCIALGGAFGLAAAFMWLRTRRFVRESVQGFGEVVGLRRHRGKAVTYAPVIRFTAPGGRVVEFTESTASSPPQFAPGERVRSLYRREDPTKARVAATSNLYLPAMVFGAIGATLLLAGVLIAAFARGT